MLQESIQQVLEQLNKNTQSVIPVLVAFLREESEKAGFSHVVFGLSGGIDSAVVAFLAVQALGKERVHPLIMPYRTSSPASIRDAQSVAKTLGIEEKVIDITPQINAYFEPIENASPLRKGNKMARERMSVIYDHSVVYQALPLGTSNKTELLLGYGTQFGDLASALNPIGDLYKTQIRSVARQLGVPQSILDKPPSADLWEEQTDEGELGFTYEEADAILHLLIDDRYTRDEVIAAGYSEKLVSTILNRVRLNQYKRKLPLIAKVSSRTIGIDFRYPRDWGL